MKHTPTTNPTMKMAPQPRRAVLLGLSVLAIGGLSACASMLGPRTVDITREELQTRLARKFPMTHRVLNMFDVTAAPPRLDMVADTNRVLAAFDLKAKDTTFGRDYIGTVSVSFGLRFEPSDSTLRILQLNVEHIDIQGMPRGFQQMLQDLGNKVAREQLQDFAIHQFKPDDLRAAERMGYQVVDIQVTRSGLSVHLTPRP